MSVSSSYENISRGASESNLGIDTWEEVPRELLEDDVEKLVVVEIPPSLLASGISPLPARQTSIASSSVTTNDIGSNRAKDPTWLPALRANSTDNFTETSSVESLGSIVHHVRGFTVQSSNDSQARTYASYASVETSKSCETAISGFSCLGIAGESLVSCKRCTFLNDCQRPPRICGACGFTLNGNPSEWFRIDELLAKQMQDREQQIAFSAVLRDERKRAALSQAPRMVKVRALVDDVQRIVSAENSDGFIRPLSVLDLTIHTTEAISIIDGGLNPALISVLFYFCPRLNSSGDSNYDKIRLDDRGTFLRTSLLNMSPNNAFHSAVESLALTPSRRVIESIGNQRENQLFPVSEEVRVQESDYLGWIVLCIPHRRSSEDQEDEIDPWNCQCFPILAFDAVARNSEPVARIFRLLSQACLDFFQTNWSASTFHMFDEPQPKRVRSNESDNLESRLEPLNLSEEIDFSDLLHFPDLFNVDHSSIVSEAAASGSG